MVAGIVLSVDRPPWNIKTPSHARLRHNNTIFDKGTSLSHTRPTHSPPVNCPVHLSIGCSLNCRAAMARPSGFIFSAAAAPSKRKCLVQTRVVSDHQSDKAPTIGAAVIQGCRGCPPPWTGGGGGGRRIPHDLSISVNSTALYGRSRGPAWRGLLVVYRCTAAASLFVASAHPLHSVCPPAAAISSPAPVNADKPDAGFDLDDPAGAADDPPEGPLEPAAPVPEAIAPPSSSQPFALPVVEIGPEILEKCSIMMADFDEVRVGGVNS